MKLYYKRHPPLCFSKDKDASPSKPKTPASNIKTTETSNIVTSTIAGVDSNHNDVNEKNVDNKMKILKSVKVRKEPHCIQQLASTTQQQQHQQQHHQQKQHQQQQHQHQHHQQQHYQQQHQQKHQQQQTQKMLEEELSIPTTIQNTLSKNLGQEETVHCVSITGSIRTSENPTPCNVSTIKTGGETSTPSSDRNNKEYQPPTATVTGGESSAEKPPTPPKPTKENKLSNDDQPEVCTV